jgi:hypothetical protein
MHEMTMTTRLAAYAMGSKARTVLPNPEPSVLAHGHPSVTSGLRRVLTHCGSRRSRSGAGATFDGLRDWRHGMPHRRRPRLSVQERRLHVGIRRWIASAARAVPGALTLADLQSRAPSAEPRAPRREPATAEAPIARHRRARPCPWRTADRRAPAPPRRGRHRPADPIVARARGRRRSGGRTCPSPLRSCRSQ